MGEDEQDRVSNKQGQYAYCDEGQATNIDKTSPIKYVTVALFVARVRVVEIVVLFNVFGKQQQAG